MTSGGSTSERLYGQRAASLPPGSGASLGAADRRRGRRDRARPPPDPTDLECAARRAAVSHVLPALGRRRRDRARRLCAGGRGIGPRRRLGRLVRLDRQQHRRCSPPYLGLDVGAPVFGDPRATCAWGPPNECRGDRGAGRLSRHRPLGFRQRLPARQLDRRARHRGRARRLAAAQQISAGRRSAPGCFRPRRRPCSTTGTRSGCAAPRRNPTRSRICSCPRS